MLSRFDLYSALIGFGAAWLIVLVLFFLRKPIGAVRDRITAQFASARTYVSSGVEARYRQSLFRAAQRSHLAGRIVDLDDIFVPPRLFAHQPVSEPGEAELADLDITYVVPKFPDCPELAALYGAPAITLEEALKSPDSLLLIGKPGAGKSTILAHLAARAAEESSLVPGSPVPIFVHVADLELPVPEKKDVAEPLLIAAEARAGLLGGTGAAEHLAGRLKTGECLLLLDGWDDLPNPHQAEVVKWLRSFRAKYPATRIIATGPVAGYEPMLSSGLAVAPVDGWTPEDHRQLIVRWTAAWPKLIAKRKRKPAAEQADPALIAGWLSGGSRGRTPLEVSLRVWTALEGDVQGPRPADWMASYVARLLPTPDGLRALERVAFDSLSQDRYGLSLDKIRDHTSAAFAASTAKLPMDPADFVELALESGGLLVKRVGNRASLSHPVVAAYLAAAPCAVAGKAEPFLNQSSPAFATAFPFFASLGDATPLVAERFQKPPDLAFSDLFAIG
ncbi:MAG: hypothetical protein HY023_12400 [Chloroflexi bacterium]|nr:hypothetical protein [Chloroflexota bacterium]